jgi:hypothetical protein
MQKAAALKEARYLQHLRQELEKKSMELGEARPYSSTELDHFTSSMENFTKAASMEAFLVWSGMRDALVKSGASNEFIEGMLKEADLSDLGSGWGEKLNSVYEGIKQHTADAVSKGKDMLGAARDKIAPAASEASNKVVDAIKPSVDAASSGVTNAIDKGKDMVHNAAQGAGDLSKRFQEGVQKFLSPGGLGDPSDRNRIFQNLPNSLTGAGAGALLSSVLGNQLGLEGPGSWLFPILGSMAGYHYAPRLMNMWKDPQGSGENAISPGSSHLDNQMPLTSPEPSAASSN